MKIRSKSLFFTGIAIPIILAIFYFIKLQSDSGNNYKTYDTLLGKIIFHSPIVLSTYLIIAVLLIFFSIKRVKIV